MKVSARMIGIGFARADALMNELRRRALERMQARIAAREARARPGRRQDAPISDPHAR